MYILFKIHRILLFQQAIQPRGVSLIHYLFKILHNNIASTSGCFFISRPGKHREGVQIWTPIDCHGSIGVHLQTCKDAWPCLTSSKPESPWLGPHFKSRGSNWTWEFFFKCLYLVKSCFFCFRAWQTRPSLTKETSTSPPDPRGDASGPGVDEVLYGSTLYQWFSNIFMS